MPRFTLILLSLFLLLGGCGDGHDHKDHVHKDHDHDHDHDHGGPNAHLWLDPVLTTTFVQALGRPLNDSMDRAKAAGRKLHIVVSIHPLASLISEIAGDEASLFTMLPQGGSPHGFEITPDVMRHIGEADLLIMVGLNLDPWAEKAAKNSGKSDLVILKFADLLEAQKVGQVKLPTGDSPLWQRVAKVIAKLEALHAKYGATLSKVTTKELVTFHNAFDLLAARYGLKVVAHLTEMDLPTGAEVTPGHLREARDAVKKHHLKTIYAEPTYPDTALKAIAEATGVQVLRLDDLGGADREGYRTYFEMMESNLKVLVEGQN